MGLPVVKSDDIEKHLHLQSHIVTATISPGLLDRYKEPPTKLIGLTRLRLAGACSAEEIVWFEVFEERFLRIWEKAAEANITKPIHIIIGIGAPSLKGLTVDPPKASNHGAIISINSGPGIVKSWHPLWLLADINRRLASRGIPHRVDEAHVHAAWLKASGLGISIQDLPVGRQPRYNPRERGRPFWVRGWPERGEVHVVLGDLHHYSPAELGTRIHKSVMRVVERMALGPGNTGFYKLLGNTIRNRIQRAWNGPEFLGSNLPVSIPAAIALAPGSPTERDPLVEKVMFHSLPSPEQWVSRMIVPPDREQVSGCRRDMEKRRLIRPESQDRWQSGKGIILKGPIPWFQGEQAYCHRAFDLAKQALENIPKEQRDFQIMLLAINENIMPGVFKIIRDFKEKHLLDPGARGEDLFQFNLQAFPLTRLRPKPEAVPDSSGEKDWCQTVIREMAGFEGFRDEAEWICARLYEGVSYEEVSRSLGILKRTGLLITDPRTGRLIRSNRDLHIDAPRGRAAINFHKNAIDLAMNIAGRGIEERSDIFGYTFFADPERLQAFQAAYHKMMDQVLDQENHVVRADQIYQINLQLFPLTHRPAGSDDTRNPPG